MEKEILKPYKETKNRRYFRKGNLFTTIIRVSEGVYRFEGDVIADVSLYINFEPKIKIKTYP